MSLHTPDRPLSPSARIDFDYAPPPPYRVGATFVFAFIGFAMFMFALGFATRCLL
jgi:hypothetical protein